MWYLQFSFFDKQEGLSELPASNYFFRGLTEEEIVMFPDIEKLYPEFLVENNFNIPQELHLPAELQQLLEYANGGGIINGNREFGYFSLQDIRYYYFAYGFPKWAPCFLPIAFNGGGKFYAYDFRDPADIKLVAVSAGDLAYESSAYLGKTLEAVLSATTNIEEELDKMYQGPVLTERQKKKAKIDYELSKLKDAKANGKIALKEYLLTKQRLENEMKEMDT